MQVCRGGEVHGLRDAEVQRCRARCRRSAEMQRCIDADADVQECRCADVQVFMFAGVQMQKYRSAEVRKCRREMRDEQRCRGAEV